MKARAVVTEEAGTDGRRWWVAVIEGGGATQARRLDQLAEMVREVVILRLDLADDAEVDVELDLSGIPLADQVDAARIAMVAAEAAREEASEAVRLLAEHSERAGWTVRDLGAALGVSHQYAAKVRHRLHRAAAERS